MYAISTVPKGFPRKCQLNQMAQLARTCSPNWEVKKMGHQWFSSIGVRCCCAMAERRELLALKPPSKSSFVARSKLRGRQTALRKLLVWTEYTASDIQRSHCATEFRFATGDTAPVTAPKGLLEKVDTRQKMCVDFLIN